MGEAVVGLVLMQEVVVAYILGSGGRLGSTNLVLLGFLE